MLALFRLSCKTARAKPKPLAVKLQPVDDLVDHLTLGAHRKTHKIELGANHRLHHLAVGRIMRGD